MKIGLVIQGPIISGGFTGQTHGYGKTRASEKHLVKFDSNSSIKENVIEGSEYFDEIILSTWKNEIPNLTPEVLSKVEVLGLDDPTPAPPFLRKPLKDFKDFHTVNTIRQFYSTVEGLNYLSNKGVTHAIKIRTDQKIDMKLLYQEFTQFIRQKNQKFFVPFLVPKTPWTIPDFYIGGEINEFTNISMAMTHEIFKFHTNIHRDIFFKAIFLYSDFIREFPLKSFFIFRDEASSEIMKMIDYSEKTLWCPGSRNLYESIIWRGQNVKKGTSDKRFNNEHISSTNIINQKHSDNIDWHQMLLTLTGSKSIFRFIVTVVIFKFKLTYVMFRSCLSYFLDFTKLRNVLNIFKFDRLKK